MSYSVLTVPPFDRQLKRLAKKYRSIKDDVAELGKQLAENPTMGKTIRKDCYKIRLAIISKGKGKSAGARVITYVHIDQSNIYLLTIYDKSEQEDISDNEIQQLINNILV
jgi:mRNA-degrading endonuclease RelE of RelBE toxin-antitoxin system